MADDDTSGLAPLALDPTVAESDLAAPQSRDHIHHTRIIKVITYRCSNPKCRAIDYLKVFENEVMYAREWVNCHNCHAGFPQVSLETMAAKGIGMQKIAITDREAGPGVMAVAEAKREFATPSTPSAPSIPAFTVVPKGKGNA